MARRSDKLRLGVVGLTHVHVGWCLDAGRRGEVELVGVCESNGAVYDGYAARFEGMGTAWGTRFIDLERMIEETRPEALSVMNSTLEHEGVVERVGRVCGERGIVLFVEKPLAVSAKAAERIAAMSERWGVTVLTNYETSWYASMREAERRLRAGELGTLRRLVFRTGHGGPVEIGCPPEFLRWLCDPVGNGGGALMDFGCYGAVASLWMMGGREPDVVTATAATTKPEVYPDVEDDATITCQWKGDGDGDGVVAVIQPSWAWTHDVKDCDMYGEIASAHCGRWDDLVVRESNHEGKKAQVPPTAWFEQGATLGGMWNYVRGVARGEEPVDPMSSLELNVKACRILDRARDAAGLPVPG